MRKTSRIPVKGALALFVVAFLAVPSAAQSKNSKKDPDRIGSRDVGGGVNFYSLEREIALGRQLAQEIERETKLVDDPIPAEFINRFAQNLARNSDLTIPVAAKMIKSEQVNAFALPGGFLFVNSGLVLRAETEAELAGPIAHEIAHVAARHGTGQLSRGHIVNLASLPLVFLGGWVGYAARQGAGVAVPIGFLKFSRAFEDEADLLGVQYMYKAGYDPTAFVDFFEKMQALERSKPGTLSEIFRSHPNASKRIGSVQRNIETLLHDRPIYLVTTSEFDDVRQHLFASLNRRKITPANTGPTLYRSGSSTPPADDRSSSPDKDGRPTLKKRSL